MGLYLISGQGQENHQLNGSRNHWVFKDMNRLRESGAARKMSRFLSDLGKSSTSKLYKGDIIIEFPEGILSGPMRSGTLSELMARNVPEGVIRLHGGHESKERSSMLISFCRGLYDEDGGHVALHSRP